MNITFADNKLEKYANNDSLAVKKLGTLRARKYKQRLDDIADIETLEEAKDLPGNFHELIGDKKGLWACDLDQPYRLIFEPHESPIPKDANGRYIWLEIKGVEIIEITDYH